MPREPLFRINRALARIVILAFAIAMVLVLMAAGGNGCGGPC